MLDPLATGWPNAQSLSVYARELYEDLRLMPLLQRLIDISCRLTGAAGGSISLVDHPGQRYTKIAERGTACALGRSFPLNEGVTGRVMTSRRPVVLDSYRDIVAGHLAVGHPARYGAVAAIPIWWRGDVIGVNVVFAGCPRPFADSEVDQLEVLTQLVASAIVTAAQRDLPLADPARRDPNSRSEPGQPGASRPTRSSGGVLSPSVAEVALELAALGERAGAYRGRLDEPMYVAVVQGRTGLHLLVPGPSNDLVQASGPVPQPRGAWAEVVDGVDGSVAVRLLDYVCPPRAEAESTPVQAADSSPFSRRQGEVAALMARGFSNLSLAEELLISPKTVEKHVGAILRKTGTVSRTAAVMRALERGWVDVGAPQSS